MSFFSVSSSKAGHAVLVGELTIYGAAELKTRLIEQLDQSAVLEIDLAGVSELDCAGVQVMLLLQKEAVAAEKSLTWQGHSAAVSQVLELLNLGRAFNAPASLVWS
jgi:anti-sigma B factor antagonist